ADETGLAIAVSHFPPGTSKWNKIEHRLFSFISKNWRGKPLTSLQVIVSLIAATTTRKGLKVHAEIDDRSILRGSRFQTKRWTGSTSGAINFMANGTTRFCRVSEIVIS
ncbi:Transposase, Rhodopirellula-type, partial [mine drainage metagenome]